MSALGCCGEYNEHSPRCVTVKYRASLDQVKYLSHENDELKERVRVLMDALKIAHPIVKEAFFENHTAGTIPGSGYHHRVYAKASETFGWRSKDKFKEWENSFVSQLNQESGVK